MGGKTDIVKGRIEEAAGVLTGNDKLRNKGKTDQTIGRVKQAAEKGVRKIVDKVRNIAQEAVDKAKRRVVANSGLP